MIIFMGVSGAGKGTQSQLLGRDLGYACLATGDILRTYSTEVQKTKILHGDLLDDEDMFAVVHTALLQQRDQQSIILDGFPRTVPQAEWLIAHAGIHTYDIEAVINLQVSAEIVHERLQKRGRLDDTAEAIKIRISWYINNANALVDYYQQQHIPVYDVNGNVTTAEVHQEIMKLLQRTSIDHEDAH